MTIKRNRVLKAASFKTKRQRDDVDAVLEKIEKGFSEEVQAHFRGLAKKLKMPFSD